jgi:putative selenate reductase molybdopterin-binding subunit
MLAAQAGGCSLMTVESLGTSEKLHPLQEAFVEIGAATCGFCSSGVLLSAYALLQQNPKPTEEEVRDVLSGHLCRCSGNGKSVQAVLRAAARLRGEHVLPMVYNIANEQQDQAGLTGHLSALGVSGKIRNLMAKASSEGASGNVTTKIPVMTPEVLMNTTHVAVNTGEANALKTSALQSVGAPVPARNAKQLMTGRPSFVDDIHLPNMLYGRILTSPHAHAIIRNISTGQAASLPGVYAILTYRDIPRIAYSSVEHPHASEILDQYCLDYIVRYVGDRVAVVVAETEEIAEQALKLIEVEYEVQPALLDLRQASDPGVVRVHPETELRGPHDATRNIAARVRNEVGDVERGFAAADFVVEGEYIVPASHPALIEKHMVITYFDDHDNLVVRTNTQIPHHIRRTLSHVLNLPQRRIRVVVPEVSGDLGGRQAIELEDLSAHLTMITKRPVKLAYSRTEEFQIARARQQHIVRLKTGVSRDGKMTANQMVMLADTGAYGTHSLLVRPQGLNALALYPVANMRFVAEVLYTHHSPAAPSQGYDLGPESFALECHLDEVAKRLRMDPLTFRQQNWLRTGDSYPFPLANTGKSRDNGMLVDECGLPECLQAVRAKIGWTEKHGKPSSDRFRRGVGIALSFYGLPDASLGTSGAMMKLNEEGSFDLFISHNENGTGLSTQMAQIAAELLGVPLDDILVHGFDSVTSPFAASMHDFSAFYSCGGAVKKVSEQMRRQVLAVAGRMLNVVPETLKLRDGSIKSAQGQHVTVAQVATYALYEESRQLMTTASWKAQAMPMTFAAQGAEVEIDMETGGIRILKAVSAVDVGTPINPMFVANQIESTAIHSLGLAISEELLYDAQGALQTTNFRDYHLLTAADLPPLETILVETNNSSELFGAKSTATVALSGMPAAIVNAVADAVDVRLHQLPVSAERVLRAIHAMMTKQSS